MVTRKCELIKNKWLLMLNVTLFRFERGDSGAAINIGNMYLFLSPVVLMEIFWGASGDKDGSGWQSSLWKVQRIVICRTRRHTFLDDSRQRQRQRCRRRWRWECNGELLRYVTTHETNILELPRLCGKLRLQILSQRDNHSRHEPTIFPCSNIKHLTTSIS